MTKTPFSQRIRNFGAALRSNQSGLALTEFAMSLPIFMGLGMYGTETANFAVVQMKASQAALTLADNASRLGQTGVNGVAPTIKESEILEVLKGTQMQGGSMNMLDNGRVILSSLEYKLVGTRPQQFIRWQRCKGKRAFVSDYVSGINTSSATFTGVGKRRDVKAVSGSAVMFVEIEYAYQPLFGDLFDKVRIIKQDAAFTIRDTRDLNAGLANDLNPTSNAATCNKFDAT